MFGNRDKDVRAGYDHPDALVPFGTSNEVLAAQHFHEGQDLRKRDIQRQKEHERDAGRQQVLGVVASVLASSNDPFIRKFMRAQALKEVEGNIAVSRICMWLFFIGGLLVLRALPPVGWLLLGCSLISLIALRSAKARRGRLEQH